MARAITVGDVYALISTEAKTIRENAPKHEVLQVMQSGSCLTHNVYVINSSGKLRGVIRVKDMVDSVAVRIGYMPRGLRLYSAHKLIVLSSFGTAGDLMRAPVKVTKKTYLHNAFKKMADHNLTELPVTDDEEKIVGNINAVKILKFI